MKNKKALADFKARRSRRGMIRGREFEGEVESILTKMQEAGELLSVTYHAPNSIEDRSGKDFTVSRKEEGRGEVTRSFGVTISHERWNRSRVLHGDVPQFWFPSGTKPETIRKRVLELFLATRDSADS